MTTANNDDICLLLLSSRSLATVFIGRSRPRLRAVYYAASSSLLPYYYCYYTGNSRHACPVRDNVSGSARDIYLRLARSCGTKSDYVRLVVSRGHLPNVNVRKLHGWPVTFACRLLVYRASVVLKTRQCCRILGDVTWQIHTHHRTGRKKRKPSELPNRLRVCFVLDEWPGKRPYVFFFVVPVSYKLGKFSHVGGTGKGY